MIPCLLDYYVPTMHIWLCAESVLALGAVGAGGAGVAHLVEVVLLAVAGAGVVAGDQLIPHLAIGLLVVGVAASHLVRLPRFHKKNQRDQEVNHGTCHLCLSPDQLREVARGVVGAVLGRLGLVQLDLLVPDKIGET